MFNILPKKTSYEHEDVLKFYEKFRQPVQQKPWHDFDYLRMEERYRFIEEELREFAEAMHRRDLPPMADALVDLVYVALGTAIELGLPWDALWQDVQRANMAKVIGTTHRGIKIDVAKPPGWVGPKTEAILLEHGNAD